MALFDASFLAEISETKKVKTPEQLKIEKANALYEAKRTGYHDILVREFSHPRAGVYPCADHPVEFVERDAYQDALYDRGIDLVFDNRQFNYHLVPSDRPVVRNPRDAFGSLPGVNADKLRGLIEAWRVNRPKQLALLAMDAMRKKMSNFAVYFFDEEFLPELNRELARTSKRLIFQYKEHQQCKHNHTNFPAEAWFAIVDVK